MPSAKRFSPAGTQFSKDTAYSATTVYSLTGDGSDGDGSMRFAYNGGMEGSTPPNAYCRGVAEADATPPASSEAAAVDGVTQADASSDLNLPASTATTVVCPTRTVTGEGAGLVVRFATTTDATPQNNATAGNYTIIHRGNGYADNDTVEIVGFPGSVLTINGIQ